MLVKRAPCVQSRELSRRIPQGMHPTQVLMPKASTALCGFRALLTPSTVCCKRIYQGNRKWKHITGKWYIKCICNYVYVNVCIIIIYDYAYIDIRFIQNLTDGLVQDCSNSFANAMELLQSCTKPSILPCWFYYTMPVLCLLQPPASNNIMQLMHVNCLDINSTTDVIINIWFLEEFVSNYIQKCPNLSHVKTI